MKGKFTFATSSLVHWKTIDRCYQTYIWWCFDGSLFGLPGDAIFFHCNVIHSSSDNNSDKRRWAFLTAYNKATNNPTIEHHHPQYTPLHKVSNIRGSVVDPVQSVNHSGLPVIRRKTTSGAAILFQNVCAHETERGHNVLVCYNSRRY